MVSAIDPTKPVDGVPAVKSNLRDNLLAAKDEIEALQGRTPINLNAEYGVSTANTSAQNSTALLQMRTDVLALQTASPARAFDLTLDPGAYVYEDNYFLHGITNYRLIGYGASIQNVHDGEGHAERSLKTGTPFSGELPSNTNNASIDGHLTDAISHGDTVIQLKTIAEVANYQPGYWALIFGLSQQDVGFPINTHFFEYVKILSVDASLGQITIIGGTKYAYKDTWVSSGNLTPTWGPAKIMPMTTPFFDWPERAELIGLTILNNPNRALDDQLEVAGRHVAFRNCDLPLCVATFTQKYHFHDCVVEGVLIDKCNEDVALFNTRTGSLQDGQGSLKVRLDSSDVVVRGLGSILSLAANSVDISNTRIASTKNSSFALIKDDEGTRVQDNISLRKVTILNRSPSAQAVANFGRYVEFIIPTVDASDNLVFPADGASFTLLHREMTEGSTIFKNDGAAFGKLTNVIETGGNYVASFDWTTPPVAGETWVRFSGPDSLIYENVKVENGPLPFFQRPFNIWKNRDYIEVVLSDYAQPMDTTAQKLYGRISRLEVNFGVTASTGVLSLRFPGQGISDLDFDLTTPGFRKIDVDSANILGADAVNQTFLSTWITDMRLIAPTAAAAIPGWVRIWASRPE